MRTYFFSALRIIRLFFMLRIMKDCVFFHIDDNVRLLYKDERLFYIYRIMQDYFTY